MTKQVRYYGFVSEGRKWQEELVTMENHRTVAVERTGVTYRTFKDAERGVANKNRSIQ